MPDGTCPRCGSTIGPGARFCAFCGLLLAPGGDPVEVRKTVTALFCDVTGSTALGERLDPEPLHAVMEDYFARVGAVLTRHGGTVEKFVGDAVMAVFGIPVVHEDDAVRACRAAIEILRVVTEVDRQVTHAHDVRFEVRIGIEAGEVLVGDPRRGSTFASGSAVNTAARLEQAAHAGECLIGPTCRVMAGDEVVVEERAGLRLRGLSDRFRAFRLLEVRSLTDPRDLPVRSQLVGRVRELGLLRQAFNRAATDRTCQLVTLLGAAGVGKTRLLSELVSRLEPEATVLRGRCLPYGDGVTYWPLVEVVRQAAGLTGEETGAVGRDLLARRLQGSADAAEIVDTLASVAGLGGAPGSVEDNAWAMQGLLEVIAQSGPVLFVVDDLHWAEPGLLDVIASICEWSRQAPLLVLVLARPELLDTRPGWGAGVVNSVSALLEPLGDDEAGLLVDGLVGGRAVAQDVRRQVRSRSGGNPLFVEQMVRMLLDDDGSATTVPPTITALLAARLDRLTAEERQVICTAAVIGEVFYPAAVATMTGVPADEVSARLRSLVRRGLLAPAQSDLQGRSALRFGHALIRDTAYESLSKAARSEAHETFARWLDENTDGPAYDHLVGSHLEAAYRNRADLGRIDEDMRAVGAEAAERLMSAGRSLLFADDQAAVALLERAEQLIEDGPARWAVQVDLIEGLTQAMQLRRAAEVAELVRAAATAAGDGRWAAHAGLELARVLMLTHPRGSAARLRREIAAAVPVFEAMGDDHGLIRAHTARSDLALLEVRYGTAADELLVAAGLAERGGRARMAQVLRSEMLLSLVTGRVPVDVALRESRSQSESATGRGPRAFAAMAAAVAAILCGQAEEAAQAKALAEQLAGELRSLNGVATLASTVGLGELVAGDVAEAQRVFELAAERLSAAGEAAYLSTVSAHLAHALLAQGRIADARHQVEVAVQSSPGGDDILTHGLASSARGWLAAVDGDSDAAQRYGDEALALLEPTDAMLDLALVHVAGAEAATLLGNRDAARRHREAAIALYDAKGSPVAVARHTKLLDV